MSGATIKFNRGITRTDPTVTPVIICGQIQNLNKINFSDVSPKLEPVVTKEIYTAAVASLSPAPTDMRSLYLNVATLAALPTKCSRHNTPSRAHSITKIIRSASTGRDEYIVIVCERSEALASACAVAKAYSVYSKKTCNTSTDGTGIPTVTVEFVLVCGDSKAGRLSESDLSTMSHAATGIQLAAKIVDTPCNEMHTDIFIQEVSTVGSELGITPLIIRGDELDAAGFGGLYSVGKAAQHPPALVVLSHKVPNAKQNIAWVGKGIVFDTGGLSMKTKSTIVGMKRDCGGAAGVLGAFYLAVKSGFKENLHAIFCLAENAVGPKATRPDDIITLYSGRTVEVNNTDAEGRLVLSDGVVYAQRDLKCNVIVDMATLTGAQGTATGKYHAAILTNNEQWEELCVDAGRRSGDLVHPLPYTPEIHFAEFASAIADMKNSVLDRGNAQSSCAGLFIAAHLGFDYPGVWLHIDMASPVHCGERATGYGAALLPVLFGHLSKSILLQAATDTSLISNGEPQEIPESKKIRLQ